MPSSKKVSSLEKTIDKELRLDTQKLLDCSNAIASALDAADHAKWGQLEIWKQSGFLHDALTLALALDKLGAGSLAQVRRVQQAQARTEPAHSPSNPDKLDAIIISAKKPKNPEHYALLAALVQQAEEYEPVRVLDLHMSITRHTTSPSVARRAFYDGMSFIDFDIKQYIFAQGGPYPSICFVWKISEPLDLTSDAAAVAFAASKAPTFATPCMMRNYFDNFTLLGTHKAGLRAILRFLHPELKLSGLKDHQCELDERLAKFLLASDADPQLYFDARFLNGPNGGRFDSFWDALGEYLQLEVGESAQERRHGVDAIAYASKIISIPSMIREVEKELHAKEGHEMDPIPKADCVRLQFTPNHPDRLTAKHFSARYKIKRFVQTRNLRKEHEDAHAVAALGKYNKIRLCRVRNTLVEAGYMRGVIRAGLDDQKQMPVGPPGLPINSGARPHGPVAASSRPAASDHDSLRQGAIINSLTFLTDIPEQPGDSWYSGTPSVVLHCATFEKSTPMFHAANLLHLLRTKQAEALKSGSWRETLQEEASKTGRLIETFFLSLQTDGGADHRNTLLLVKLTLIALKRCLGVQRLDSERCAPSASATLVHERVFSLLNLGLQHTAFARAKMDDDDLEDQVRSLSSMAEIRFAAGVGPPPKQAKAKQAKAAEEEPEPMDDDNGSFEVGTITAERYKQGKKEYLVQWAPPHDGEEPLWQPATNLVGVLDKVEEWRRSRLSPEELKVEDTKAAAAATEAKEQEAKAEAALKATAKAEAAVKAAKEEKQRRLHTQFKAAIYKVIDMVKPRLTALKLKNKYVECPEPAPPEVEAELHASLRELDDQYDPKYSLMSQLKKMPVLEELLMDPQHTFDSTYMLSMQDCENEGCKFGCVGWSNVPIKAKEMLRCKPMLPMNDPDNPGHMYAFDEAAVLAGGTSERDFPSKKGLTSAEEEERRKKDKGKELHPSKVRAVVICSNCGRPRCIYARLKDEATPLFKKLDSYLESVDYTCGDPLFPEDVEDGDKKLTTIFYISEATTCRSLMEKNYFNYGGLGGREEFEHVCARCGKWQEESPLINLKALTAIELKGKTPLPLCTECETSAKERLGEDWHNELITVKRSDKVTEELGRKEKKDEEKKKRRAETAAGKAAKPKKVVKAKEQEKAEAAPFAPKKAKHEELVSAAKTSNITNFFKPKALGTNGGASAEEEAMEQQEEEEEEGTWSSEPSDEEEALEDSEEEDIAKTMETFREQREQSVLSRRQMIAQAVAEVDQMRKSVGPVSHQPMFGLRGSTMFDITMARFHNAQNTRTFEISWDGGTSTSTERFGNVHEKIRAAYELFYPGAWD